MSQLLGLVVVCAVIAIAAVVAFVAVRSGKLAPIWAIGASITLFPAALATLIAVGATSCPPDGCVSGSEKDLLKLAVPAIPVLVVAFVAGLRGFEQVFKVGVLVAQALTAVAIWKTNAAGSVFLALLVAVQVGVEVMRNMQRAEQEPGPG